MKLLKDYDSPSHELPQNLLISPAALNLLEQFLANCRRTNKSEHTLQNYRTDLLNFLRWWFLIEGQDLRQVNAYQISEYFKFLGQQQIHEQRWKNTDHFWNWFVKQFLWEKGLTRAKVQRSRPLKKASQKRHLSALKNFFQFLVESDGEEMQKFTQNPVKSTLHQLRLKDVDVEHTTTLTPEEWEQLEEIIIDVPGRLTILLLFYAGPRLAELCRLKYSDFQIENGVLRLERKGGKIHLLRVYQGWPEICDLLQKQQNRQKVASDYVFSGRKNGPLSERAMYQRVMKILKRAGCPPCRSPHSFRKGLATELYRRTKDLLLVRDYLNHSDAKVTQTYIDNQLLMAQGQEKGTSCFLQ